MGSLIEFRPSPAAAGPGNGNPAETVEPAHYAIRRDTFAGGRRAQYVIVRLVEIDGHTYGVEVPTPGRPRWHTLRNKVEARALARSMGTVMPGLYRRYYTAPMVDPVRVDEGQA